VFYVLLLVLAAAGAGIYFLVFMQNVPGAAAERFGTLEPLPEDCGEWKPDEESPQAAAAEREGLKREVRFFFEEGKQRLLKQGRYRSIASNEVVRVDPDQVVKRRRLKS
jgi:hypothetical protein